MKKLLLLMFAAMCLPLVASAQSSLVTRVAQPSAFGGRNMAPRMVTLAEGQKILGHYDSDTRASSGLRLPDNTGVIPISTVLTPQELEMFQGGRIVAFRVALCARTPISRVFVAPVGNGGVPDGVGEITAWSCSANNIGWNEIQLETPYEINLDENTSLMIGFDYEQQASNYPLSLVTEGTIYPTYGYVKVGRINKWKSMGLEQYGNLSVQCVVESDHFPDYMMETGGMELPTFVKSGDDMPFIVKVKNRGAKTVTAGNLGFDLFIDGNQVGTITNAVDVQGQMINLENTVSTSGLDYGTHTLKVVMSTLNGEPIESPVTMSGNFKVYSGSFQRQNHLVEQLTSTYCTYCPLGNSMLRVLTRLRNDVIWVAIHGDLGSGHDPYTSSQGNTLLSLLTGGAVSYPSGCFDRTVGWDEEGGIASGLGYYEQYHEMVAEELGSFFDYISEVTPTFATINISTQVDQETRQAHITVSGDVTPDFSQMMGSDAKLNVYITEDNLIAPQLNLGTWEPEYTHNGVFRTALNAVTGTSLNISGETYKNEYTLTVPEEWVLDNLNVVAFISRPLNSIRNYSDMYVDNAQKAKLVSEPGGIEEILGQEDAVPVAFYDIMGRQHAELQQGINIVKMSNGKAIKVLVK